MTQEEKDLIYKDACCRLPYRPYAAYTLKDGTIVQAQLTGADNGQYYGYILDTWGHFSVYDVKLYLRSMSNIHKDSVYIWYVNTLNIIRCCSMNFEDEKVVKYLQELQTWLISRHYDINHLLERNLAFEAPEGMYKIS